MSAQHLGGTSSPWRDILPQTPSSFAQLDQSTTADITIIGAGFAGLAAAQRLTQLDANLTVAVLDAGEIAEGASGRNSGFMIDLPHDLASENYSGEALLADQKQIELNRHAIAFAKAAVEQYDIDRDYFNEIGKVNGAASSHADQCNNDYGNHLDKLQEPNERLDAQAMFELTGSRHYLSGIYTPGTVLLQPAGYSLALATGLTSQSAQAKGGIKIYERSPALDIKRDGNHWVIESSKASVTSGQVIIAANGHLESFGFAKNRLMHIFLYASMTHEFTSDESTRIGGHDNWGITPSDPMGTTMRRFQTPSGGSRIITRTCAHYLPEMHTTSAKMTKAAAVHREKFKRRFNHLTDVQMEYQWAGHLCLSHNGVSVTKELEPGLFSACVQNGLGATRGILTGISAAEQCLGIKTNVGAFFESEKAASLLPLFVATSMVLVSCNTGLPDEVGNESNTPLNDATTTTNTKPAIFASSNSQTDNTDADDSVAGLWDLSDQIDIVYYYWTDNNTFTVYDYQGDGDGSGQNCFETEEIEYTRDGSEFTYSEATHQITRTGNTLTIDGVPYPLIISESVIDLNLCI